MTNNSLRCLPVIIILKIVALTALSCSPVKETDNEKMHKWFEWGTGFKLPKTAKYIVGKDNSVWLSDIYLKVEVPPNDLKRITASLQKSEQKFQLELPESLSSLSGWKPGAESLVYFQTTTGTVEEGGFTSQIGINESTGIIYCHLIEYAP